MAARVAPIAQLVKGRLSDAGGLRFESQAGWVTSKSIPSHWRDKHPAVKSLRPPEHHAGHSIRTAKRLPRVKQTNTPLSDVTIQDLIYI